MSLYSRFTAYTLVVLVVILLNFANGLQYNVKPGEEVCISDIVPQGEVLTGDYTIAPPGLKCSVNVYDPAQIALYSRAADENGKFSIAANTGGEYKICVANNDGTQITKQITMILKSGTETKDYANIAKTSHLKPLEIELQRINDLVTTIQSELSYLDQREKVQRSINDSTYNRVIFFSCASLLILVALSAVQVTYLKTFFRRKHLID